jgi:cell division protein FtsZ
MFGITIGASAPKKPLVQRTAPSTMRLSPEAQQSGETRSMQPRSQTPKVRNEEYNAPVDEQLDIPAFLRRQVN